MITHNLFVGIIIPRTHYSNYASLCHWSELCTETAHDGAFKCAFKNRMDPIKLLPSQLSLAFMQVQALNTTLYVNDNNDDKVFWIKHFEIHTSCDTALESPLFRLESWTALDVTEALGVDEIISGLEGVLDAKSLGSSRLTGVSGLSTLIKEWW